MTTATTGTGTVTLGSANSGEYYSFAEAGMSNGDTADYVILDGTDVEMGVGTYTSSGTTFSRDTVTSSRISGTAGTSKISLSGSATIFIGVLAAFYSRSREVLTAARTYYVRTDGNDSNNGLANTSGGAFLTVQAAMNKVATIDFGGFTITIQIADGTYSSTAAIVPRMTGQSGPANLIIQGNSGTPANVVLDNGASFGKVITSKASTSVTVKDLKLTAATNGYGLFSDGGHIEFSNIDFGSCGQAHVFASRGFLTQTGNTTISGNAAYHILSEFYGLVYLRSKTITASGSRAFTSFVLAQNGGGVDSSSMTFTGTFTGQRYSSQANAIIQTYGSGASYFPGNSAGATSTGGLYQ